MFGLNETAVGREVQIRGEGLVLLPAIFQIEMLPLCQDPFSPGKRKDT